jgi:hypothetical protein
MNSHEWHAENICYHGNLFGSCRKCDTETRENFDISEARVRFVTTLKDWGYSARIEGDYVIITLKDSNQLSYQLDVFVNQLVRADFDIDADDRDIILSYSRKQNNPKFVLVGF